MKATEFKRSVSRTLRPKNAKEGFKAFAGKTARVNLVDSVMFTRVAVDELMSEFQPYILGYQIKPELKEKARPTFGKVLHGLANVARILKVRVPPSQRKIKPRNTQAFLLTEINKLAGDMLNTVYATVEGAKVVELNAEEKAKAQARFDAAQKKAAEKAAANPPKEGEEKKAAPVAKGPRTTKIVAGEIDTEKLSKEITSIFNLVYELSWAIYDAPVAVLMEGHIKALEPKYPAGFFDPPPKKEGAAKHLPPGKKKEQTEKTEAPATPPAAA